MMVNTKDRSDKSDRAEDAPKAPGAAPAKALDPNESVADDDTRALSRAQPLALNLMRVGLAVGPY